MIGIENFEELIQAAIILVPFVTGLVEVVKRAGGIEGEAKRFVPLMSIVIGATAGFLIIESSGAGAIAGVVTGLAAVGLWETGSNARAKKKEPVKG